MGCLAWSGITTQPGIQPKQRDNSRDNQVSNTPEAVIRGMREEQAPAQQINRNKLRKGKLCGEGGGRPWDNAK